MFQSPNLIRRIADRSIFISRQGPPVRSYFSIQGEIPAALQLQKQALQFFTHLLRTPARYAIPSRNFKVTVSGSNTSTVCGCLRSSRTHEGSIVFDHLHFWLILFCGRKLIDPTWCPVARNLMRSSGRNRCQQFCITSNS